MPFRFAFRTLLRSPWYAATAIGTIALTIALGATVFAVVDGVLFKPLPYREPDRLFNLMGSANPNRGRMGAASLSPLDVKYLNAADPRLSVTGFGGAPGVTPPDRPDLTIWAASIDTAFFDVLGHHPLVGGFTPDHYAAASPINAPRPAIVTHGFWRQWLGSDPAALGRTVDMAGSRLLIAGVLPHDFVFPGSFGRFRPDILVPMVLPQPALTNRWNRSLSAIARLHEAITEEEAQAKFDASLASRVGEYPTRDNSQPGPYVAVLMRPLDSYLRRSERPLFTAAFAGAALLILLGAINVAGLSAARARDRTRELSIRAALGAGRWHLVAGLLAESIVIAVVGGLLGVVLAGPMLTGTIAILPEMLLLLKPPAIDWRVMIFAMLAAVVPVVLFALAPAAAALRAAPAHQLAGAQTSTQRVRTWGKGPLLAAESAIGITLVVTGSLLLASFIVVRGEDAGFDSEELAVIELSTTEPMAPEERAVREARAFDRMKSIPGIRAVATIGGFLLEHAFAGSQFKSPPGSDRFFASDVPVSGAFFEIAGLRLLEGRFPTAQEIEGRQPVVAISEETARAYWPTGSAVGQILESSDLGAVTVVGVVEEARLGSQDETHHGEIYLPRGMSLRFQRRVYLLKTAGDPEVAVRDLALVLKRDVPGVLVRRAESFDRALAKSVRLHQFRMILFALAGGAGLLLLAVGIAGLVACGVARRVREIGIRSALGAQHRHLVTMIVVEHLRPAVAGVMLGLLASWWATQLVNAFLYEIDAHEPLVWAAAVATLLLVAVVAAWIPARRASAVDPIVVLRIE